MVGHLTLCGGHSEQYVKGPVSEFLRIFRTFTEKVPQNVVSLSMGLGGDSETLPF